MIGFRPLLQSCTTHAIFSKDAVIEGESRAEFENLLNGLRSYFQPEGTFEEIQIEKLANSCSDTKRR